jgi:uncharacterized protein YdhG (YjbR/CyaY superfamily)
MDAVVSEDAVFSDYLASVPEERRAMVAEIHEIIRSVYPQVEVSMRYKMPTYEVADGWVALANQKRYVSLYTCGYHHIAEFKRMHPTYKTGKGCINFKPTEPIPAEAVRQVVRHAIEHPKP